MSEKTKIILNMAETFGEFLSDIKALRKKEMQATTPYTYLSTLKELRQQEIQITNVFLDSLGILIAKARQGAQ